MGYLISVGPLSGEGEESVPDFRDIVDLSGSMMVDEGLSDCYLCRRA